jgi:hypothetical protein
MNKNTTPKIDELYPHLTEQEQREAETNLEQYLLIVLHIYERISTDPEGYAQLRALTAKTGTLSCTPPRSNPLTDDKANNDP